MRLSRWGQSAYETDADVAEEANALSSIVRLVEPGEDAEIVVVHSKIRFGRAELARAPSCQLVITTTSGTDHLDLTGLAAADVTVCRLPLVRRDAVVETSLMMMLWGMRAAGPLQAASRQGRWARGDLPELNMRLLGGSRVGLLGLGVIGSRMAEVLSALGVEVLGCDPRGVPDGVTEAPLESLLHCDVLSVHCDLNPSSAGIVGVDALCQANPGLVLVNTARGAVVDVQAAVSALSAGQLGAVCLDVFPHEPFDGIGATEHVPGLMMLPHAAGFHGGLSAAISEGLFDAVSRWCAHQQVPHRV
jgi:phosphoglycerate dehydrogenase-like enzyme